MAPERGCRGAHPGAAGVSGRECDQEMCPMWDGDGCPCERFGLDRDALPTDGTFTMTEDLP